MSSTLSRIGALASLLVAARDREMQGSLRLSSRVEGESIEKVVNSSNNEQEQQ